MASKLERCLIATANYGLKLSSSTRSASIHVPRRHCYESGGMRYLDMFSPKRKRDPNDPRRAKLPDGPKLGADPNARVPWTYGHVKPHYHVFQQLWPEPTLLKRKFGPKMETAMTIPQPVDHVEVPLRKVRSSTAVLEALSSTSRIEANTAPYDMLDDPYLLPLDKSQQYLYRGARASGRRMAKRIVEDLPYFFDLKFFRPDPVIDALESGKSDWDHEITEEGSPEFDDIIKERLEAGRHDLAFKAYETSLELKAQVSPDVMASLFQIAAWNNLTFDSDFDSLRPSAADEVEELTHLLTKFTPNINDTRENVWEDEGIAEDLWRRIPKCDALHCAFVQSLVRHGATQRAYDHFQTMIAEDRVVDLPTFNALLAWHNEIDTEAQLADNDSNLKYREILTVMAERGIRPTTTTFNAVLHGLSDKRLPHRRRNVEQALIEMIDLGLRPTLGTLSLLIRAWRTNVRYILRQVDWLLKIVESGDVDLGVEDWHDHDFFPLLSNLLRMDTLRLEPETADLILRAHRVVHDRPDYRAATTRRAPQFFFFLKESMFILYENGHGDEAMRLFSNYVPNFIQLDRRHWCDILSRIAPLAPIPVQHLVTLGNQLSSPLFMGENRLSDLFADLLVPAAAKDQSELDALVATAANYFRGYQKSQEIGDVRERRDEFNVIGPELPPKQSFHLSGFAYGNLILTLAHGDDLSDAIGAFSHYLEEKDRVVGAPPVEGVALLMRRVAKSKSLSSARKGQIMVDSLKFLDEMGAKRHLAEGLDLMIEEVSLDASSALIVTELKNELDRNVRKSPPGSLEN